MKTAPVCCLLAFVCCGLAEARGSSRLVQRLARAEPQSVVLYGTSLTSDGPWVGQMQDWLSNTYRGSLTLINSGQPDMNSKGGLAMLDTAVLSHRPDTVILEFGVNDAFTNHVDSSFNLSVAQARSNLAAMIDRILTNRYDTEIILQTMNPVWDSTNNANASATMRPALADYDGMYREVAAERGLLLVDHAAAWATLQATNPAQYRAYIQDGMHPSSNGTAAITTPGLKRALVGEVAWFTNANADPVLVEADVCVYGDTAAAICAAVQVARQGKSCVLLAPQARLGGMTSGGLGFTDAGSVAAIGGLAREFYRRVYWHYRDPAAWTLESRAAYLARSGVDPDDTNQVMITFEPKVAADIIEDMLAESGAKAIEGRLLRSGGGVRMAGTSIQEITTDDGKYVLRAKMFIDATYEGDLMAEAGVPYVVGREANTNYDESINGIQRFRATSHQLPDGVDPYVVPGSPASGLLPGIEPAIAGPDGTADGRLQAFNYRMCLTDVASNRVMVTQPPGYNEEDYRLLFRAIAAGMPANFFTKSAMPNRKTDSNNQGGFSTDFIGGNYSITGGWNYAEASYAKRDEIIEAHRRYQIGFLWALQNSTNVPGSIRSNTSWSAWGLPLDEFTESGNWSPQLYVREARRMRGALVMTEKHVSRYTGFIVDDPIGQGSYNLDSHHVQRYVTTNGIVKNEGDVQVGVASPYGISYRSIVPPTNSVKNLLVPVCLSATHMALGSIRMEPVYMILGHSAASAAVQAINDGVAVQAIDYPKLRAQLLADAHVLPGAATGMVVTLVLDNSDTNGVVVTGSWTPSTATAGFQGTNYLHDNNANKGSSEVRYTPALPMAGTYSVAIRWTSGGNRAAAVPVDLVVAGGTNTFVVNQQVSNGVWVLLTATNLPAGTNASIVVRNGGTSGFVIADAVRFSATNNLDVVRIQATDADAYEASGDTARFLVSRDVATLSALTVLYSVGGTATPTSDYAVLSGSVTIPAGELAAPLTVQPVTDGLVEDHETVIATIVVATNYFAASPTSAVVTIRELPMNAWRVAHFNGSQLADPAISGDLADPDGDRRANLLEYALGGEPLVGDGSSIDPRATFDRDRRYFNLEYAKAAPELVYDVQASESLSTPAWSVTGVTSESYNATNGLFYRGVTPDSQDASLFLRLRITRKAGN